MVRRVTDAQRSTAVYVKRRFRCSWLPEIPGEYSATLDKKCAGFAQADRAGDCRKFPFSQTSADQETKGKSRDSERAAGIALGLGSLGDSLPQRELLSGDTNSLGVAARRLLHFVNPIPCLLAVLVYPVAHVRHGERGTLDWGLQCKKHSLSTRSSLSPIWTRL